VTERLDKARAAVASGKRIDRPSDDPSAAAELTRLRGGLSRIGHDQEAARTANLWLKSEDVALGDVQNVLRQVRTSGLAGANPQSSQARAALAVQIRSLGETLLQKANATDGTQPIFAGYKSGATPFGGSLGAVTYAGDAGDRQVTIGEGITLTIGHSGADVFNMDVGGVADTRPDVTQPSLFASVEALATAVEAGDTAAIQQGLAALDAHGERIGQIRVQTGIRLQQVNLAEDRLASAKLTLNDRIGDVEAADLSEALVELQTQENVYQALTYVTSKLGRGGLIDWLR
jgi:flagellar hook-associated protein 3 FlgL